MQWHVVRGKVPTMSPEEVDALVSKTFLLQELNTVPLACCRSKTFHPKKLLFRMLGDGGIDLVLQQHEQAADCSVRHDGDMCSARTKAIRFRWTKKLPALLRRILVLYKKVQQDDRRSASEGLEILAEKRLRAVY